jgi:hypothetical protein
LLLTQGLREYIPIKTGSERWEESRKRDGIEEIVERDRARRNLGV